MIPEVRAAADRFILETANVKSVATKLPAGGLERQVVGEQRTVRQLLAHLASATDAAAEAVRRVIRGEAMLPPGFTPDEFNRQAAEAAASIPLPEVIGRLDGSRDRMLEALGAVPDALFGELAGRHTLLELVTDWSLHYVRHALDLADTLPELRFDPMVLDCLLYADFGDSPERAVRQAVLMAEVRERFARERAHAS